MEPKIFIVEDEPILVEQLRIKLEGLGYWVVGEADNGVTAVDRIISVQPEIVIMDINIKGELSGVEVGLKLNSLGYKGGIIFLTSLDDDSIFEEAREVLPFDYLIKPVRVRKLKRTLELLLSSQVGKEGQSKESIILKGNKELYKIDIEKIKIIEIQDKFCLITVEDRMESIRIRIGLGILLQKLKSPAFVKVHRSYVVNEKYIESYDISMNQLSVGENLIPVSRTFRSDLLNRLK